MGDLLRTEILKHYKSIKAFSRDSGFRETTVLNWVNDRNPVPLSRLAILAEYFSELDGTPPNIFIMRMVFHHPEVNKVMTQWRKQQKDSQ